MGQYIPPEQVQSHNIDGGLIKVLLGELTIGDTQIVSPIESHHNMNYWVVELHAAVRWSFTPPESHTVAWVFGFQGESLVQDVPALRALMVLDGQGRIEIEAPEGSCKVLIGTAEPHRYPLIYGPSSIHTNHESLRKGLEQIERLGRALKR